MTTNIAYFGKAVTAIAAIIAFTCTPSLAQETATPAADPPAPEPVANEPPAAADLPPPPPAPRPKVEAWRAHMEPAKPSARSTSAAIAPVRRVTARRATVAAPLAAPVAPPSARVAAPAPETAAPAPSPAEPLPPAPAEPAPVAEPARASAAGEAMLADLAPDGMLPAGAGALGLLALGGTAVAMRRRRRRREDAEFEARQRALAMVEAEPPVLELGPAAEVRREPAFTPRPQPMADPLPPKQAPPARFDISPKPAASGQPAAPPPKFPERIIREPRSDEEFMFRRAGRPAKHPAEQG